MLSESTSQPISTTSILNIKKLAEVNFTRAT
jgi:hypothetical protein